MASVSLKHLELSHLCKIWSPSSMFYLVYAAGEYDFSIESLFKLFLSKTSQLHNNSTDLCDGGGISEDDGVRLGLDLALS
jgi:hypothetical protein